MDRKRMIALGAATVAVAVLTGTAIQKLVPQSHPALKQEAPERAAAEHAGTKQPATELAAGPTPANGRAADAEGVVADGPADMAEDLSDALQDEVRIAAMLAAAEAEAAPGAALHESADAARPAEGAPMPPAVELAPAELAPAEVAPAELPAAGIAADVQPDLPELRLADALPSGLPDALARAADMLPRMAFVATDAPVVEASLPADPAEPAGPDTLGDAAPAGDDCTPALVLAAAPAAMIDVAFDAPCHPGARAVIRHAGLAVTGRTSGAGMLDVSLPAFAGTAEVTVAVTGGPTLTATVQVPDLAGYQRAAVQWQNADAFQLHAFESGAEFGAPGHVWAEAPSGAEAALGREGGFLSVLGDGSVDWPLMAEVYTFPAEGMSGTGAVELVIEAAVTPETCGREMLGETLDLRGGALARTEITLAMPSCDAPDGFVILNNALSELMLARN